MYYQIFRGDDSSKNYKVLSEILEDFDRQDVKELYRLVKERYSTSRPEGHTYADREEIPSKSSDDFQDVEKEIGGGKGNLIPFQCSIFLDIEDIMNKDTNAKLPEHSRYLPSEWNTYVVVWRNKPNLDTMRFDDLYNNFKIFEQEVKGTVSSSSSSQNMDFVSSPSSTNDVNTTYGVSTANSQVSPASTQVSTVSTQVSTANLSDDTVYAFLSSQPNGSQLVYEDLKQIHEDEIEEMDLKCPVRGYESILSSTQSTTIDLELVTLNKTCVPYLSLTNSMDSLNIDPYIAARDAATAPATDNDDSPTQKETSPSEPQGSPPRDS
ncbi:hypothetical protein Tco_0201319 [Tanacetum coccineum]